MTSKTYSRASEKLTKSKSNCCMAELQLGLIISSKQLKF